MDIETAIRTNERKALSDFSKGEITIRCLEMLTPQGSEFYNDPIRCFEHIQQELNDNHKRIIDLIKKNKLLSQQNLNTHDKQNRISSNSNTQ